MTITVEKTPTIARSMAYQAKAISGDLEVVAMYGTTAEDARSKVIQELEKLYAEMDDILTLEMINNG